MSSSCRLTPFSPVAIGAENDSPAGRQRVLQIARLLGCFVALVVTTFNAAHAEGPKATLDLATFVADVSPPLHRRVDVGFIREFTGIEHPLLAKGVLLRDADGVYVICAIDYGGLCNDSYDMFRAKIARAAGTITSRVAVQSLHQHTAPAFDANTDRILYADRPEDLKSGLDAAESAADRIARSVRNALGKLQPVTHVSVGKAKVDRVASKRRVPRPDGSIIVRFSSTAGNEALRDAPEGLIDPWLRTITFYNDNTPLVCLHYYATHPQTTIGGRVTYDVVGMARERLEKEIGVPQVYFTGCGGNVTMGKYNDGSAAARTALEERIYDGLKQAAADCNKNERQQVTRLNWRTRPVRFPLREDAEFTLTAARKIVNDSEVRFLERLRKAMLLAWIERVKADRPVEFSAWSIANIDVVHLPGEPFVQFQLAAQKAQPDRFVCVAGYGECAPWYVGEDRIYTDRGGYEQSWSFVGPCERLMHDTISQLLKAQNETTKQNSPPFYPDKMKLLVWRDASGAEHPITKAEEWSHRRGHILANMQKVMGMLPKADSRVPLDVQVLSTEELPTLTRKKITYAAAKNYRVPAYLLIPKKIAGKAPAMLCMHGTSGGRGRTAGLGQDYPRYALELAERGYVTIAPDYTLLGENQIEPGSVGFASGTMMGIWSHMRAVDLLESLPEVDATRMGCVGVSLGGHNALFIGAFDPRMKVIVTSSGFDSFHDYMGGNLSGWCQPRYMMRIQDVYGKDPNKMPFDFPEVLAALAPRHLYVHAPISDSNFRLDSVKRCVAAAAKVYRVFGAEDHIATDYPEGSHGYPIAARDKSYRFIDSVLKPTR